MTRSRSGPVGMVASDARAISAYEAPCLLGVPGVGSELLLPAGGIGLRDGDALGAGAACFAAFCQRQRLAQLGPGARQRARPGPW
jgi:hypothetical protein